MPNNLNQRSNMSSQDIVQRAVDAALDDIKRFAPEEFAQLEANPSKKSEITKAAHDAATEHLKLAEELRMQVPADKIAECLAKHLPKHRLELIETGLQVPTYRLDITKKADGHNWVDITRDGNEFMPSKKLQL